MTKNLYTYLHEHFNRKCSTDCGEGVHERQLYCSASEEKCNQMQRPQYEKMCKHQLPCGGKWFTGPWRKVCYSIFLCLLIFASIDVFEDSIQLSHFSTAVGETHQCCSDPLYQIVKFCIILYHLMSFKCYCRISCDSVISVSHLLFQCCFSQFHFSCAKIHPAFMLHIAQSQGTVSSVLTTSY